MSFGLNMFDTGNPAHWLVGIVVLGVVCLLLRAFFSSEARERPRRERNHRRVVSKAKRPTISLAVKTEETKDEPRR